jgi:hypothetical protein
MIPAKSAGERISRDNPTSPARCPRSRPGSSPSRESSFRRRAFARQTEQAFDDCVENAPADFGHLKPPLLRAMARQILAPIIESIPTGSVGILLFSATMASSSKALNATRTKRAAIPLLPWNQLESLFASRSPVPSLRQGQTSTGSRDLVSGMFQVCFIGNEFDDLIVKTGAHAAPRVSRTSREPPRNNLILLSTRQP